MRRSWFLCVVAAVLTMSGCGGGTRAGSAQATRSTAASTSKQVQAGIVGRWQRVNRCEELVAGLKRAGLAAFSPYAWAGQTSSTGVGSFRAGSPKPTQADPCAGAIPRKHSHFFTSSGQFGSVDWLGGQVDDGPYRVLDAHTVYIGSPPTGAAFHYRIRGDRLTLTPLITHAMLRRALANPHKFSAAEWAVSVAYAGHTWRRVPCQAWC